MSPRSGLVKKGRLNDRRKILCGNKFEVFEEVGLTVRASMVVLYFVVERLVQCLFFLLKLFSPKNG